MRSFIIIEPVLGPESDAPKNSPPTQLWIHFSKIKQKAFYFGFEFGQFPIFLNHLIFLKELLERRLHFKQQQKCIFNLNKTFPTRQSSFKTKQTFTLKNSALKTKQTYSSENTAFKNKGLLLGAKKNKPTHQSPIYIHVLIFYLSKDCFSKHIKRKIVQSG